MTASTTPRARRRRRRSPSIGWLACVVIVAWIVGGALTIWQVAAPADTPVEQLLDPRSSIAFLLIGSATVVMVARWLLAGPGGRDARRRRGAWIVALGAGVAYGALFLAIALEFEAGFAVWFGYAAVATGLVAVAVGTMWWGSARALYAAFLGPWCVAVITMVYDIGWQLSKPAIAPFEWCVGGMDCIAADPSTPAGSGWMVFGAFWVMIFLGSAQLVLLLVSWMVRPSRAPLRS